MTPFSGEKGLGSINSLPNFLSCIGQDEEVANAAVEAEVARIAEELRLAKEAEEY
jgi:hypothetical protein